MRKVILAAICLSLTPACKKNDDSSSGEGQSFLVEPRNDGYRLSLKDAAFEQKFLFTPGVVMDRPSLEPYALDSVIVRFELNAGSIAMVVDETTPDMQTPGIASKTLIAEFDVEEPTGNGIYYIDFDKGMEGYVSDLLSSGISPGSELNSAHIDRAFVRNEALFVSQTVDVTPTTSAGQTDSPGQFQYTLRPYSPKEGFTALDGTELMATQRAGYFLNNPTFIGTTPARVENARRWDIRDPIVWSISANTPPDVRDAVAAGIKYWNAVLGGEYLTVVDAPADVTALEPGYNVVQWLNDDERTSAYAQFISDPLTGQTIQSYVILPSAWYFYGKQSFAQRVKSFLPDAHGHQAPAGVKAICGRGLDSVELSGLFGNLLQADSDEAIKRTSLDLVTTVVAHEVGHTLGLRHNFVAKATLKGSAAKYNAAIDQYLKTGDPGDTTYFSSVMDYSPVETDAAVGAQIRAGTFVGAYDSAAIAWGYLGKPTAEVDGGLFCTDENTLFDLVIECKRFIEPGQPGLMEFDALANIGIRAARSLAALFLSAKSPYDGPSVEATHYALQPSTDAKRHAGLHLTVLNQILNEATGSGRVFLTKRFGLNVVDELNDEEIRATESAYQGELLATIGGPKALMAPFAPKKRDDGRYTSDAMELAYAEFSKLVNMPSFQNGTDPVGKANAFSDEELAYMRAQAPKYFHAYEQTFLGMLVGALSDANFDPEGSIGGETAGKLSFPYAADPTELATALNDLANAIATAEVPERFTATIDATTIDVAKPGFSYGTRAAAMALFSSDLYDQAGKTFNQGGSDPTKALLQARLDALTGGDGTLLERLPRDIFHEWGYVGSIMAKLGDSH